VNERHQVIPAVHTEGTQYTNKVLHTAVTAGCMQRLTSLLVQAY
jgi:hypothetical protein